MRFSCPKDELSRAITIANRGVPKAQKTILDCILFEAQDESVTLKATDRSLSICTTIDARVEEPGTVAIPAKLLTEFVNHLPLAEVTVDEPNESQIEICARSVVGHLQKMNAQEFPAFAEVEKKNPVRIPTDVLTSMVNQTIFAVATSNDRPIFTGVLFDIFEDKLVLVALDGFRLAIREEVVDAAEQRQCVVPARALRDLIRSFGEGEDEVEICVEGGRILFDSGRTQFICQLLEGTYMPYQKLFPTTFATNMQIDRDAFQSGLERASIMGHDGETSIVELNIKEDMLELSGAAKESSSQEPIPIILRGNELVISLNARFVLDVLRVLDDEQITMSFNTDITACAIERGGPGGYRYLILPVQRRRS